MEKLNAMTEKLEQFFDRFFEKQYVAFRNILDKAFEYTYRETEKGVFGLFNTPEQISDAAKKTKEKGFTNFDCLTPFPVHGLEFDMGFKRSRLPYVTFFAGLTGFTIAFLLQFIVHEQVINYTITRAIDAYPNLNSYPLNIGGKPTYSWPAMIPICFELTILFGGLATVAGLFMISRIPRPFRRILHPSITDDKFCLWIPEDSANYDEEGVKSFLQEMGAEEITSVKESA
ncbi:MAG: DUF3341 domain-containing protein [Leptospiraceae bacterium]